MDLIFYKNPKRTSQHDTCKMKGSSATNEMREKMSRTFADALRLKRARSEEEDANLISDKFYTHQKKKEKAKKIFNVHERRPTDEAM